LFALYKPFLERCLASWSVQPADVEDLVQDVFKALVEELPHFQHNGQKGAFRKFLRQAIVNRVRDFKRRCQTQARAVGGDLLEQMEAADCEQARRWDAEHDRAVVEGLLARIRPDFTDNTWRAFQRQALDGAPAAQVAAELGLSAGAVYIARSRVLSRLRQEARGLLDV
jgi:RNA polymerase sigma-70 factor (ECF subfamily)